MSEQVRKGLVAKLAGPLPFLKDEEKNARYETVENLAAKTRTNLNEIWIVIFRDWRDGFGP